MGQFRHSSCGTGLESGGWTAIGIRSNSSISIATGPKLDHYGDGKSDQVSVASLKFKIMMQICQDNHKDILNGSLDRVIGMEWNAEDIQTHQRKMLDVLFRINK